MLNILYEEFYLGILKGSDCLGMEENIFKLWYTVQILPSELGHPLSKNRYRTIQYT